MWGAGKNSGERARSIRLSELLLAWWHRPDIQFLIAAFLLAVAAALLAPYAAVLWHSPLPIGGLGALAIYLCSKRLLDALLFGIGLVIAESIEPLVGPQVLTCLTLPLLALTRKARFSALVGTTFLLLILEAIRLKERFAGTPLTWQDFRFFFLRFQDNVYVMFSQPSVLTAAAIGLFALVAILVVFWRWDSQSIADVRGGAATHFMMYLLCFILVWWACSELFSEAVRQRNRGVWWISEVPLQASAHPLSRFLATAALEPNTAVERIDTAAFKERFRSLIANPTDGDPADIVLFLQESQFNPEWIEGCSRDLCRMPIFGAEAQTTAFGPLRTHIFGGGTWLSEFSLATGVPHSIFGFAGDFAPFNVAPGVQRSFAKSLRSAGYRTVAVYPTLGGMMNGRMAYAGYGFDAFYDAEDLRLPARFDTPDRTIHEAALRVLARERAHGKPVFLMVLTIFNHAEHGVRMDRVPLQLMREAARQFGNNSVANNVADYVWRTRQFETAMQATSAAIFGQGRPAVIAWFGDHQPPFGNALELRSKIRPPSPWSSAPGRYLTWYHVATNKRDDTSRHPQPQVLDIVFLPGILAQAAAAPLDDWLGANIVARDACNGLLNECKDQAIRDAYLSYIFYDLKAFQLPWLGIASQKT